VKETFVQSGFEDQRAMHVLLATTHSQRCRNEGHAFSCRILTVDESWIHSIEHQLRRHNAEWRTQASPRKKIARRSQVALKTMLAMFFGRNGLVLDHPLPIGTTVNGQYYCALLKDKVRSAVHSKQSKLLQHGVIVLQDTAAANRHLYVQNLV
jgi:hypothetical protein